jgi:sugar phosphate permease
MPLAPSFIAHHASFYRRLVWGIFAAGFVLAFFARYSTAVIVEDLEAAFGTGAAGVSLLAAAYFWPYAAMQPPAGVLADTIGPRRAVSIFLVLAALGTFLFALAGSLPVAVLGRAAGGFGVGIVYVCALRVFANWFRPSEFSTVVGLFNATGNAGGLIAAGPFAAVLQGVGWRTAFIVSAVLMLALALLIVLVVRDSPHGEVSDIHAQPRSWYAGIGEVLRGRNFWLLGTYAAVTLGITAVVQGLWMVPFLQDVFGMSKQRAANLLTLWAVGLTVGVFLWGLASDRLVRSTRRTILASLLLCAAVIAPLALFGGRLPEAALPVILLAGGLATACWTPAYAQMRASVAPTLVGTAIGLLNFMFFFGAGLAQQLSGLALAGRTGPGDDGPYRAMFAGFVAVVLAAFVAVWFSREAE